MGERSGPSRSPSVDFLPQRSETLRESFQEKMRQRGSQRGGRGGEPHGEIRFLAMSHGPHPEVDRYNTRFLPGSPKLKATLEVVGFSPQAEGIPPVAVPLLTDLFPNLLRHVCCGGNDIHTTLFRRRRRNGCALPPTNHGTDLCHLMEHLALELVSAMSASGACSGITCAYREPPHRFDLFVECPDPRVGAAALRCAAHILIAALTRGETPPGAGRYAETARYFLGRPRSVLNPGDLLADLQGDPVQLEAALRFLAGVGFLEEDRFTFDFSGTLLYRYRLAADPPPLPLTLS